MKQRIISNTNYEWPNFEIDYDRKIVFFNDTFHEHELQTDAFKILYIREAEAIRPFEDFVIKHHKQLDVILTYNDKILNNCSNAYFLPFGSTWVHNYSFILKDFSVSHITGHKMMAPGHKLRQQINANQDLITIPKKFYVSKHGYLNNINNNPRLGDEKEPLFNSQFHICIENSQQKNYFSEKLIDCFVTKTVPIYWGCINIEEFFNTNGLYIVNSFEEIIEICNSLTPETYSKMEKGINDNFIASSKYIDVTKNLEIKIKEILK